MLISKKYKFIFIHIYKVGGGSIRNALEQYTDKSFMQKIINSYLLNDHIRTAEHSHIYNSEILHITAYNLKNNIPADIYNSYFKFAFVRNPWDWMVSNYHYIIQTPEHYYHNLLNSMDGFETFIKWITDNSKKDFVNFQKDFITDPGDNIIVDFIGRFEKLENDFSYICDKLSLTAQLSHFNPSSHTDYRNYYTSETKSLVAEYFKKDIELFSYSFDGINI